MLKRKGHSFTVGKVKVMSIKMKNANMYNSAPVRGPIIEKKIEKNI